MISKTSSRFWKSYKRLPEHIKKEAKNSYRQFKKNPYHPSLRFKQIHPTRPIFSIRISMDYRALGIKQNNVILWFWIGSHNNYDNLIKQM